MLTHLQYKFWYGEAGYFKYQELQSMLKEKHQKNTDLANRNRVLAAKVTDLKDGTIAVEEHARLDLSLVKPGEILIKMNVSE